MPSRKKFSNVALLGATIPCHLTGHCLKLYSKESFLSVIFIKNKFAIKVTITEFKKFLREIEKVFQLI